ncbi:glycosyltransferase family 61 protein [Rufibacter psychrotolerans]|uniref:glycosyltransferase family 61 protein n=1 Tax=Rufibacter psychrotolerans TaxID=2812556 RepID=UPI00196737BF|nr:glycosyltransferase family 61 protein [Rufibacter sp. SYSU D00308]
MIKRINQILKTGESICRRLPVNLVPEDIWLFSADRQLIVDQVPLLEYENVNVTPESIVWNGLQIDKNLLIHPHHTGMYNWKYCLSNMIKRTRVKLPDDNYFLCTDYWAANYYHWMGDALPRIFLVKDFLPRGVLLLPGQYKAPFFRETLNSFKIKEVKTIPVKQYFSVPRLYTPPQPVICGQQYSSLTAELRNHLVAYFKPKFTGKHKYKNVYISRRKAAYRWVLNEDQVSNMLASLGFKVLCFEDFSLHEQVEIAYNAENLVSAHGANLTNLFYMQPGTNVLEFRKSIEHSGNNSFWIMADSIDVNYYYLNCDYIDRRKGNYFDLTVDLNELEKVLHQMGALV